MVIWSYSILQRFSRLWRVWNWINSITKNGRFIIINIVSYSTRDQINSVSIFDRVRREPLKFYISRTKPYSKNPSNRICALDMKNKHAKFGGPSYNNFEISALQMDRRTDRKQTDGKTTLKTYLLLEVSMGQLVILKLNIKTFSNPE